MARCCFLLAAVVPFVTNALDDEHRLRGGHLYDVAGGLFTDEVINANLEERRDALKEVAEEGRRMLASEEVSTSKTAKKLPSSKIMQAKKPNRKAPPIEDSNVKAASLVKAKNSHQKVAPAGGSNARAPSLTNAKKPHPKTLPIEGSNARAPSLTNAKKPHQKTLPIEGSNARAASLAKKAKKLKKEASPIEDINATAASLVKNANKTMYSVLGDLMGSFDAFSRSLKASKFKKQSNSMSEFVASVSSLLEKARQELIDTTVQRQTVLETQMATFASYAAKANSTLEVAAEAVDKVVQDAKQANTEGPQVLLQMKCCSEGREAKTHRGIWDWVSSVFSGSPSPCSKARESISMANATILKLSEGLDSTNSSISDSLHDWANGLEARVQLLQADVQTEGSGRPQVLQAMKIVPTQLKKALKSLDSADSTAAKSLRKTNALFEAAYASVNDLDLQATAACAKAAAQKKKTNAAPCDHHC